MTTFFDESINQLLGSFLAAASSLVAYEGSIERADGEREVEVAAAAVQVDGDKFDYNIEDCRRRFQAVYPGESFKHDA